LPYLIKIYGQHDQNLQTGTAKEKNTQTPIMKAILFSIGTRGDIEPFLAIAQLLSSKKWDVLCVFPEQFRETVQQMGIPFKGFDKDFLELLDSEEAKKFMGGQGSFFQRLGYLIKMSKVGIKLSKKMTDFQHRIQLEEEPDRIIYHPKCNIAIVWGMANPGKSIMVSPIPFMAHPIDHINALGNNYGKYLNRFSFWITNTIKAVVIKRISRHYRKYYGEIKITASSIKKVMLEIEKTFYTISPSLFPPPHYWPSQAKVIGHYERVKTVNWQPDVCLINFLERHEKILFITFGSMSNSNPREKTRIIIDVLKKHNFAAIINTSWGGLEKTDDHPENIIFVNNIPYNWIFPKIYAVIHHGGAGTTHTALKYGCPSLLIPHILDQPYWSKTISGLLLGPEGIPIKKFSKEKFEYSLIDLMNNQTYKNNAALISGKMKDETNIEKLYDMIIH